MWATESEDATETGKDRPHRPDRRKLEVKGRKPYVLIHQSAPNQTKLAELQLFFFFALTIQSESVAKQLIHFPS